MIGRFHWKCFSAFLLFCFSVSVQEHQVLCGLQERDKGPIPACENVAVEQHIVATQKLGDAGGGASEAAGGVRSVGTGASLVLIHPPMPEIGMRHILRKEVVLVGRDESADLTVARTSISRRHAELRCSADGGWAVADMGSTNGTFLNDEEVEDAVLEDGDHVQFGDAIFKFVLAESAAYHDKVYAVTVLDGITSIYNQRYFFQQIDRQGERDLQAHRSNALLMIEVDWFAGLCQDRGKLCGNSVLRAVAMRIVNRAHSEHLCARIDGEEFSVFLPGADFDDALDFAEGIRQAINGETFSFDGSDFGVSVSIGVAGSALGAMTATQSVEEARKQLAIAKTNGRNCVSP